MCYGWDASSIKMRRLRRIIFEVPLVVATVLLESISVVQRLTQTAKFLMAKKNKTPIFTYYIGLVRGASSFFSVQTQACFIVTPKSKPQGLSIGNQSISS